MLLLPQSMGQLLMTLACSLGAVPLPTLDYVSMHYSPDFVRLLALLLGVADGGVFSWRHLIAVLGERILQEHDSLSIFNDHLVGREGRGGKGWEEGREERRAGGGGGGRVRGREHEGKREG